MLQLVTQGIKESVLRFSEREKQRMMSATPSANPSMRAGQTTADNSQQNPIDGQDNEFERIRLSSSASNSDRNNISNAAPGASKPRVLMDMLTSSFYQPRASLAGSSFHHGTTTQQSLKHPATQSKSSKFSTALHGLMSVVGAYIPGEYGVDPINYHLEQSIAAMRSNTDTSYSHHTHVSNSIYDDRGVPISPLVQTHMRVGDPMRRLWMEVSNLYLYFDGASSHVCFFFNRKPSKNLVQVLQK